MINHEEKRDGGWARKQRLGWTKGSVIRSQPQRERVGKKENGRWPMGFVRPVKLMTGGHAGTGDDWMTNEKKQREKAAATRRGERWGICTGRVH